MRWWDHFRGQETDTRWLMADRAGNRVLPQFADRALPVWITLSLELLRSTAMATVDRPECRRVVVGIRHQAYVTTPLMWIFAVHLPGPSDGVSSSYMATKPEPVREGLLPPCGR